ncbi:SAICAR synthase-like protein [Serendipita vermifera]|nr:SAICAR synthase-like protein [Serendipita vermifera]
MTTVTSTGDHIPLASQVGGHKGVLTSADGSQIIKPCLPSERKFYETVVGGTEAHEGFARLLPLVPKYFGILEVLQNISVGYSQPNILDIKLGTVLYDDDASEEKKQRMIKSAAETTSFDTGVRITGFQVYDTKSQKSINTPKDYGRALKVAQLPEAIARFFPIRTPVLALSSSLTDKETTTTTTTSTSASASAETDTSADTITPSPIGTKPSLLLPVLEGVLKNVKEIREAVSKTEMRMVGGSVLIVYEGDESVLEKALEAAGDGKEEPTNAYVVKLIDFAHTKLQDGIGPDEGVLKGLDTTISLLEGRIAETKERTPAERR